MSKTDSLSNSLSVKEQTNYFKNPYPHYDALSASLVVQRAGDYMET